LYSKEEEVEDNQEDRAVEEDTLAALSAPKEPEKDKLQPRTTSESPKAQPAQAPANVAAAAANKA